MAEPTSVQSSEIHRDAAHNWASYMNERYNSRRPPPLGSVAFSKLEEKAREKLSTHPGSFNYTFGSAGTSSTHHANLKAFENWRIVPRMLVNATERDISVNLFGTKYPAPLIIGPVGVQGLMHEEAELATARAASTVGIPFTMSTASSRSIEQVAKASGNGPRWYQLYWPRQNDVTISIINRAKAAGFSALFITLDTTLLGWRPHDIDEAYLPFAHGFGIQVGTSDPVFMGKFGFQPTQEYPPFPYDPEQDNKKATEGDEEMEKSMLLGKEWLKEVNSGFFRDWDDVAFLREHWEGPLVLKGIQHVADAEKAIDIGIDGIVVSNHGGRQIDGAIPSLYALDKICQSQKVRDAQDSGKLTVLFDSGIRTGSDIIKAIALGAQGVLLARPFMYGLALGGELGVEQVVRSILADLEITLGLSGHRTIAEIQGKREILARMDQCDCISVPKSIASSSLNSSIHPQPDLPPVMIFSKPQPQRLNPAPRYPDIIVALDLLNTNPDLYHWIIFVQHPGSELGSKFHATTDGLQTADFRYERQTFNLASSASVVAAAVVGSLGNLGVDNLDVLLSGISCKNIPVADIGREPTFTCRVWVREAMRTMHSTGIIYCPDVNEFEREIKQYGSEAARLVDLDTFDKAILHRAKAQRQCNGTYAS